MQVFAQITLDPDEQPDLTADAAAAAILTALGGDETTDFVQVTAARPAVSGTAGVAPGGPAPGPSAMMPPPIMSRT